MEACLKVFKLATAKRTVESQEAKDDIEAEVIAHPGACESCRTFVEDIAAVLSLSEGTE